MPENRCCRPCLIRSANPSTTVSSGSPGHPCHSEVRNHASRTSLVATGIQNQEIDAKIKKCPENCRNANPKTQRNWDLMWQQKPDGMIFPDMPTKLHLTEEARVLTRELLQRQDQICRGRFGVHNPDDVTRDMICESVISYGKLCELAGLPSLTRRVGRFLREIAVWCEENGWPPLNALAINSGRRIPGDGYDGAPGCSLTHWLEEVKKCIACDCYPSSTSI